MTTPTPNERDREVTDKVLNDDDTIYGQSIASYRQEIEARKECEIDNMHRAFNDAVEQRDANRRRISTLEAALEKAEKCLSDGHTQQCDMRDSTSEYPHCTCGHDEQCDKALAAIREAKEGK